MKFIDTVICSLYPKKIKKVNEFSGDISVRELEFSCYLKVAL